MFGVFANVCLCRVYCVRIASYSIRFHCVFLSISFMLMIFVFVAFAYYFHVKLARFLLRNSML